MTRALSRARSRAEGRGNLLGNDLCPCGASKPSSRKAYYNNIRGLLDGRMGHVVSLHEVERVVCCMHLASHSRRMLSFDAQEMPDHLISQATIDAFGGFRLPLHISDPALDIRDLHLVW
jgi:hypothetical protein